MRKISTNKLAHAMATTETTIVSKGERRMWGLSLHGWENLMALSLAAAALAAAVVGFATWKVIQLTRESNNELAKQIAGLNVQATKLAKEAEELRAKNLKLEKTIAPREVEQSNSVANLKRFAGFRFEIKSVTDPEARRLAGQIEYMLLAAGWTKVSWSDLPPAPADFTDGVTIEWWRTGDTPEAMSDGSWHAIAELIAQLMASDIRAGPGQRHPHRSPAGIRILVGLKPIVFDAPTGDGVTFRGNTFINPTGPPPSSPGARGNVIQERK